MPDQTQTDQQTTLVEEIDATVADILDAIKQPSITAYLVVAQQVIGFIVFFGIVSNSQATELGTIINAAVGLGVLVVHAVQQYSGHKAAAAIVQAKTDLLATGWPAPRGDGALLGRAGSRLAP